MGGHVPSVLGACLQMCADCARCRSSLTPTLTLTPTPTRCANCARCRFISLSIQWRDCSWYWSCPTVHRMPHRRL